MCLCARPTPGRVRRLGRRGYKYRFKLLYEITVFMRPVKVRKTKSLKLSSAAARP